jgi:hypothetical protein
MIGSVDLQISSDMSQGLLAQVTTELAQDLERAGVAVRTAGAPAKAGERGTLAVVGKLILEQIGSKGIGLVADTLKGFVIRDRTIKVSLTRPDGAKIEFDAKNIDARAISAFLDAAKGALG